MQILGVAFDLEGPVVNVEPAHHGGWLRAAREIGVDLTIDQAIERVPHFIGGPDTDIVREIFAFAACKPACTPEEFVGRKRIHYEDLLQALDLRPRAGFLRIIKEFRRLGLKTAIGTAVELEQGILLLRRSGLDRLFPLSDIVFSTDVRNQKPAPDCFLETARRMGIDPRQQLIFEDSPRGVKSGVAAGSRVIGMPVYDNIAAIKNLVRAGVSRVCPDWRMIDVPELLESLHDLPGKNGGKDA